MPARSTQRSLHLSYSLLTYDVFDTVAILLQQFQREDSNRHHSLVFSNDALEDLSE